MARRNSGTARRNSEVGTGSVEQPPESFGLNSMVKFVGLKIGSVSRSVWGGSAQGLLHLMCRPFALGREVLPSLVGNHDVDS